MHRADKLGDFQNISIFLYFAGKHILLSQLSLLLDPSACRRAKHLKVPHSKSGIISALTNSLWLNCIFLCNKYDLYCTYASEASSSLIKASLTGGRSCLMFRPLTYGADSLSVSFNCAQNKIDT